MRVLKGAVCLAMLSAGIAAIPTTTADAIAPAAAAGTSLVSQMKAEADGSVTTSDEASTGKVGFVRTTGADADLMPGVNASDKAGAVAKADKYLAKYGAAFGAAKGQLTQDDVQVDELGWTVDYIQSYQGIPVFGSLLRAHIDKQGDLTAVNGYAAPDINLSTSPSRTASAAASQAIAFVKAEPTPGATDEGGTIGTLRASKNDLMVYRLGSTKGVAGANRLAYVVEVTNGKNIRETVFVDANSKKILNRYSMVDNALDRELYEESPDTVPVWSEGDDLDAACTEEAAGDCADDLNLDQRNLVLTSGESYWFFRNAFNRDSYDGAGATRKTVNNDPTISCPNANWNGQTTNYCDGVTSDDVVGHEWGHAYTEYTHGLIYQWQSGALNEAYSDIWGETLDLINNREDEGEGDISAKRNGNLCAENGPRAVQVVINNPANVRKVCLAGPAVWGGIPDTTGLTSDIVLAVDPANAAGPTVNDGCSPLTNAAEMNGKIGLVFRGTCAFTDKAINLVDAGATAVVIANTLGRGAFGPGGGIDPPLDQPVVGISEADGLRIKDGLTGGAVNVTVRLSGTPETADSYRWLIGEKSGAFGGAIRDMWAPTCAGDPGKVSDIEYSCSTDDQGGVHSNSGVANHAYALLVDGGTYNGVTVGGIGLDKAAHIYYRAMNNYQTPVTGYADHADALAQSCTDLIGATLRKLSTEPNAHENLFGKITAADCANVDKAAQAIELRMDPVQCDFGPQLDPNTPATCGAGTGESTPSFSDDFEEGLGNWELDSVSVFGGPTRDWKSTQDLPEGNRPDGSTQAAFGPAGDVGTCTEDENDFSSANYMTSPVITVGADGDLGPRLTFDHNIQTELGFDGGTVSLSVNGGDFETIPADAYVFNGPSVLAEEAAGSTNPLAGEDGFTGTDGGKIVSDWGTSIVDLEAAGVAVGDDIQIQFAIGRDGCGGVVGWYVDNVEVTTCVDLLTPTVEGTHAPEPSTFGAAHAVNVTVGGSDAVPSGTVTVKEGPTTLGSAPLTAGAASVTLPTTMSVGAHNLTVEYSGDAKYDVGSDTLVANVGKAAPTVDGTHNPEPAAFGAAHAVDVTVGGTGGVTPTGTVTVKEGSTTLGSGPLTAGAASVALPTTMAPGVHNLTVEYAGDSTYTTGTDAVTATIGKDASTVSTVHTPEPVKYGSAHSLAISVTGSSGTPTGSVTIKEGAATLGTAPLTGGNANFALPTTMAVGTHTLTVEYTGDATYAGDTDTETVTVSKATGTITAKAKPATVKKGDKFKSKVTVTAPAGVSRTGTVVISYKGKTLGQGTVAANGKVKIVLTANFKPGKTITLTATFSGNAQLAAMVATYDLKMAKK